MGQRLQCPVTRASAEREEGQSEPNKHELRQLQSCAHSWTGVVCADTYKANVCIREAAEGSSRGPGFGSQTAHCHPWDLGEVI